MPRSCEVLIASADSDTRWVLLDLLTERSSKLVTCLTISAAQKILAYRQIRLIFSDYRLPVLTFGTYLEVETQRIGSSGYRYEPVRGFPTTSRRIEIRSLRLPGFRLAAI